MTDGAAETIGEFLESYRSKIKQINESSLQVMILCFSQLLFEVAN